MREERPLLVGVQLAQPVSHYRPALQAHASFDPEIISIDMYPRKRERGRKRYSQRLLIQLCLMEQFRNLDTQS